MFYFLDWLWIQGDHIKFKLECCTLVSFYWVTQESGKIMIIKHQASKARLLCDIKCNVCFLSFTHIDNIKKKISDKR